MHCNAVIVRMLRIRHGNERHWISEHEAMLEIKNLHVKLADEDRTILNGLTLVGESRRSACHHGAERLRQVDALLCACRAAKAMR